MPKTFDGGFENLGAQGAFVVSASSNASGPHAIKIQSLAGNPCAVHNPWPNGGTQVEDLTIGEPVAITADESVIRFDTANGRTYAITPSR